jgi:membrane-associated phospholipid phosphatase
MEAARNDRRTLRRLPANLGRGIMGVVQGEAILPAMIGGVATGGASVLDQDVRSSIQDGHPPGQGWRALGAAGGPVWSSAFVATLFTVGRISHDERFAAASYDILGAAAINVVCFQSIKLAVRRERPDGSNRQSFPSGHTSNAFALATVVERHYGWKTGVPAYLLAGLIGASRLQQDKHCLSDVVAGATLGYIVGRATVRVNDRPLPDGSGKGPALSVAPIMAGRARGLRISLAF